MPCEPALCANEGCFCAELAQLCLDVVALLRWLGRGAHDFASGGQSRTPPRNLALAPGLLGFVRLALGRVLLLEAPR